MSVSPKTKAALLQKVAAKPDAEYLEETTQILQALAEHLTEMAEKRNLKVNFTISNQNWPAHAIANVSAVKVVAWPQPAAAPQE